MYGIRPVSLSTLPESEVDRKRVVDTYSFEESNVVRPPVGFRHSLPRSPVPLRLSFLPSTSGLVYHGRRVERSLGHECTLLSRDTNSIKYNLEDDD